ncbi:hypothetical protein ACSMXN_13035 [Jatrophihabitans sp. DSM 45814]
MQGQGRRSRRPLGWFGLATVLATVLLVAFGISPAMASGPAPAAVTGRQASSIASDAQAAADVATTAGYRTGIAVLDLQTGDYTGAGDDSGEFASESVAKVLIATELLLTGQMTGATESTAYQMITESDDDDADSLYGLAGGDNVLEDVSEHYNIPFLGSAPKEAGWWGNTEITAKGMVSLYAAVAKDPVVGPWLINAMAHTTEYGADGTDQFFGIASATTGAAIKQGWGDDGNDSPNAVFNSTGYVDNNQFAVAILTDGDASTYGQPISSMVTAEAQALMPDGQLDDSAAHEPTIAGVRATATGSTVHITGSASDVDDASGSLTVDVREAGPPDAGAATSAVASVVASGATNAASHSFDLAFPAADGEHSYEVTAVNVGAGSGDATTTTTPLKVDGDPSGKVSTVAGEDGGVRIEGIETDPNLGGGVAPRIRVVVDGGRPDVMSAPPSPAPTDRGYELTVPAQPGAHEVAITYLHSGDGRDVAEGTWQVTVAATAADNGSDVPANLARAWENYEVAALVLLVLGGCLLGRVVRRRRLAMQARE